MYFFSLLIFEGGRISAFIAALLFAVHPIHVEAVTGIVGRAELLCSLFSILGYFAYARAAGLNKTHFGWLILALFAAALSFFSKETGFTILAMMVLLPHFYFAYQRSWHMMCF